MEFLLQSYVEIPDIIFKTWNLEISATEVSGMVKIYVEFGALLDFRKPIFRNALLTAQGRYWTEFSTYTSTYITSDTNYSPKKEEQEIPKRGFMGR